MARHRPALADDPPLPPPRDAGTRVTSDPAYLSSPLPPPPPLLCILGFIHAHHRAPLSPLPFPQELGKSLGKSVKSFQDAAKVGDPKKKRGRREGLSAGGALRREHGP